MGICKYLRLAKMLGIGQEHVNLYCSVQMSQISHLPGSPAQRVLLYLKQ